MNGLDSSKFLEILNSNKTPYKIIQEENTKEITTEAEVLNQQEICVDLHNYFNFDFLAFDVYIQNNFANKLRRSFVLYVD